MALPRLALCIVVVAAACGDSTPVGGGGPNQPTLPATRLAFVAQPTDPDLRVAFAPALRVALEDSTGQVVTSAHDAVTLVLAANSSGAALSGTRTVSAVNGIATFSNLSVDQPGDGFTVVASAAGLAVATSAPFQVLLTFASLSAGGSHTCGVTTSGVGACWGGNGGGQLGDGTTTDRASPVPVAGGGQFRTRECRGEPHLRHDDGGCRVLLGRQQPRAAG